MQAKVTTSGTVNFEAIEIIHLITEDLDIDDVDTSDCSIEIEVDNKWESIPILANVRITWKNTDEA
jgi:hypothetical protein